MKASNLPSSAASSAKAALLAVVAAAAIAIPVVAWAQFAFWTPAWPVALLTLSRLLGLLGFVHLFFQFVLSSRIRLFESALGLDRLFIVHRSAGIAALVLLLLHGVLHTVYELAQGFLSFNFPKILGISGFVLVALIAITALAWRALRFTYETWKRIHWLSYVILPLVFVHSLRLGTTVNSSPLMRGYLWALLGLYALIVVVKLIQLLRIRRVSYTVSEVIRENHDVTSLHITGPSFAFSPGQFMIINTEHGYGPGQSHPFTISSAPDDPFLRVSVKAVGDFTTRLPETQTGSRIIVDGPYGVFSYTRNREPDMGICFIAGGIGITPFLSQLRHMKAVGYSGRVRLIWGNKTTADICFAEELEAAGRELNDFACIHVLSSQEDHDGERGFITGELLQRHVEDFDSTQFFVCGPPVMMRLVVASLHDLRVPRARIHYERFAL